MKSLSIKDFKECINLTVIVASPAIGPCLSKWQQSSLAQIFEQLSQRRYQTSFEVQLFLGLWFFAETFSKDLNYTEAEI